METTEKKMAAAMAAVAAYLQQEEEEYHRKATAAMASARFDASATGANLWGQSGRQSMMQMRNLMQMKGLHRLG